MKMIRSLNSTENYLSAIHQARRLERGLALAEEGKPRENFSKQIQEIASFQKMIEEREKGKIPQHLQSVHRILGELLTDLTRRVELVSLKAGVVSREIPAWGPLSALLSAFGLGTFCIWQAVKGDASDEISPPSYTQEEELKSSSQEEPEIQGEPQTSFEEKSAPTQESEELPTSNEVTEKTIAGCVRDVFFLLEIGLAGRAMNRAKFWLALAGVNRVYNIAKLSNLTSGFSEIEAMTPIFTSRILERLTDLDRLAMIGFLDLIPNDLALQTLSQVPGLSFLSSDLIWSSIRFTPFLWPALPFSSSNPERESSLASSFQDLSLLAQIYFASRAIQNAQGFLTLVAAHRVFQIMQLCNLTESVREKMPLPFWGVEKVAEAFDWVDAKLPVSTSTLLERMTCLDSWAVVGGLDLIRNMPGVQNAPMLSSLLSDRGWSIIRFSPFILTPLILNAL